jgi:hypothetical protein
MTEKFLLRVLAPVLILTGGLQLRAQRPEACAEADTRAECAGPAKLSVIEAVDPW